MAFKKIEKLITTREGDIYYEFEENGYQILYIQPANEIQSNLINYGFTGPTILCFPDQKSNFVGLRDLIEESGLKQVAQENGVGIIMVNPKDKTWKNEGRGAYEAVTNNLGIAQMNFRDGLAIMKNDAVPDEQSYNILGSCVRMYVYGFGSGADYLALHYLKKVSGNIAMGDLGSADVTPVCVTLKDLSVLPEPEDNDIHVVSINNTPEQNAILRGSCGDVLMQDDYNLKRDFRAYVGNYRRWVGKIMKAYNYDAEGIVAKAESVMIPIADDNASFRKGTPFLRATEHKVGYVTFYDKNLDVKYTKRPLMLVFHGGGDSAYATASLAEWPEIGQENGFITVAVEMHMKVSANEVVSLIDHLCEEYAIDEERIYATGFSMGGIKSWDLFQQCPERFAGLLPMDAADYPGNNCFFGKTENINENVMVPLLYVGGVTSPLVELPCHDVRAIERMKYLARVNGLNKKFELDENKENWEDPYVGDKGDGVEVLHDEMFPKSEYFVNYYNSEDGNCYTVIMAITEHGHEIRPFTNRFAYNFIKRFARKDGKIVIEE